MLCHKATAFCCVVKLTAPQAFGFAHFGQGSGDIILDEVDCNGDEAMLGDCSSNPIGVHNCLSFEAAGVGCYGVLS